jgi:hypothetical protein
MTPEDPVADATPAADETDDAYGGIFGAFPYAVRASDSLAFKSYAVLGGLLFVGYGVVWLVVVAFVIWLFYRLVVAVERIAAAQERIASALEHETVAGTSATETDADGAEESLNSG